MSVSGMERSSLLLGHPRMAVLMIWNRGNGPGSQLILWRAVWICVTGYAALIIIT